MFMRGNRHHWHTRRADVLLMSSQFGRKMSPAWLNSLSTPAEDGTGVLNWIKSSIRDRFSWKSSSSNLSDLFVAVQVVTIFSAFTSMRFLRPLWVG